MRKKIKKFVIFSVIFLVLIILPMVVLALFFDEAVLVRKSTIYRIGGTERCVALTFDDGPSPVWTPKILDELKKQNVKATFFMLGDHVEKYPDIARRVAQEGHEIENHSYDHHVLLYYKPEELEKEIRDAERIIKDITGKTTKYFRPPKAWITNREKKKIKQMGYGVVLWTLNAKDWVGFDDKYVIRYLMRRIEPGDIILFHDSGGALATEGGDRSETVKVIPRLVEKLKERGYKFVTISQLLDIGKGEK